MTGKYRACSSRGNQRGYLLLPVAIAIALIGIIAFLISSESAIEVDMTAGELEASRAAYVARAGLQHALQHHAQQGCGPYTDLIDYPFGADEYDTKLSHDLGSTSAYTVSVDQDNWIRSDDILKSHPTQTDLHVKSDGGNISRALFRYDLSALAPKAAVLSATAWFYVSNSHPEGPVDIHALTADWTETDATWDTLGDKLDSRVIASIPAQPVAGVWVSANLTSQVQAWLNGEPNYGIALNTRIETVFGWYSSRESAFPPYLEVVVGTPPTSPAKLRSDSKIVAGGEATIVREVTLVQQPGFTHLQPDAAAADDAEIWDQSPNNNYGNAAETWVSSAASDTTRSLLRFNLGAIPVGAKILQATLSLERQSGSGSDQPISAHRITNSWDEASVTWNEREAGTSWGTAGADFFSTAIATTPVGPVNQRYAWNITPLVQGWVDGSYPNHGVALVAAIAGMAGERFYTSDAADPATWPNLSITYACVCGLVCAPLQGSGNLLMVVINPTVLVAEDQKAKDLFESWGYTVNVISESANQATYDAEVAANDVVFISETVNSNQVGTKLANAPIGVVSQDGDYNPDFGLAPGASLKVGNAIDIVNTDHYITQPFAVGTHQIYAADMEQAIVTGSLTADQQTLAEIGGDGSLVVLDRGAAMQGGGNAAGRRVILPLGTRYRFDWDHLNANGRLLVQRALEWGMNKDKVSKGNLLLVVVNPGSLTTQESAKKTLFESWGYSVNLIDESDNQSNFDAAVAVNNVVYITEDVISGNVNTKLVDAAIGVVTEEDNLSDEFGMAAGIAWESGTQVEINDNSHYITSPFSLGLLTILTANESLAYVTGTQSPDLGRLASSTSGYGVVTLEAGAALFGGGSAAGRRAQLPWGGDNFDVNHLNDDGLTILQRALEWGAGAQNPDYSTELLFVVTDPASLTAYESAKKTLIESWGYTVNLIDDADSVANFVTAFGVNGVIYVSGEVSDTAVSTKLVKTTLGVVNEQISLHDELLLSTSASTNDFTNIFVINDTHYITEGLPTGWYTIATSDQPLNALEGTLAPGMTNLAEVWISGANYDFGLAVVDTGGQLNGGEVAAGRRAQLPWGTASFDFSALNANGQDLMRRAIEWAGGAEIDLSPIAHWRLDDAVGSTAIDSIGGNDATLNGNPAWTTGTLDGALEFDGSGDYATTDNPFTPPPVGTVLFWMKVPGSPGSHGRILGLHDTWEVRHVTTGTPDGIPYGLVFDLGVTGVNTEFVTTVTVDTPDQWYFVAATYDTNNDAYQVFLDGTLHKSGTYPSSLTVPAAAPLSLGTRTGSSNYFTGTLDDVQIFDRILSADEIADFYAAGAPPAPGYTELYEPWSASSSDSWETVSLASLGVPADAVVEVAVVNDSGNNQRWGGVRAVGSSLERRFQLHEAQAGGTDIVTMHVQANADAQIQHYSDRTSDVSFVLLGYWTGAAYSELFQPFTANGSNSWEQEELSAVGANRTAEIVMQNTNTGAERLAGVREINSSWTRRFNLQEAEDGGVDAATLMVNTDEDSEIEVYAQNSGDVDFHVVGYWSTPPGTYIENGTGQWNPSSNNWETVNLGSVGVPANAVVNVMMTNLNTGNERWMGLRSVGSSQNRRLDLHEPEDGGADLASIHVTADDSSEIQSYSEASGASNRFAPVGWWVLSP